MRKMEFEGKIGREIKHSTHPFEDDGMAIADAVVNTPATAVHKRRPRMVVKE
jgi:hypothetical protein